MEKWLKTAEILALDLQYLPKTKVGIAAKAKREGWETTEKGGNGGVARLYKVPEQYFSGGATPVMQKITLFAAQQAAQQAYKMAQIVGDVDVDKFVEMFMTLCVTEPTEQPSMSHNARHKSKAKDGMVVSGAQTAGGNITTVKTIKGDFNK